MIISVASGKGGTGKTLVATRIPFDNVVTESIVKGVPVVEASQGKVTQEIELLWRCIARVLEE